MWLLQRQLCGNENYADAIYIRRATLRRVFVRFHDALKLLNFEKNTKAIAFGFLNFDPNFVDMNPYKSDAIL